MTIKIFVEGGGNSNFLRTQCRRGFSEFFCKAGLEGRMPSIVACGGRSNAYDDFCTAVDVATDSDFPVLLVDSETAVEGAEPWPHLKTHDGWDRPAEASSDQAHLMVQTMEAWFLADRDTLAGYFGREFRNTALPAREDVENITKDDLYKALKDATRACKNKGQYDKGAHSFDILGSVDPENVQSKSPHARRLVSTLKSKAEAL